MIGSGITVLLYFAEVNISTGSCGTFGGRVAAAKVFDDYSC